MVKDMTEVLTRQGIFLEKAVDSEWVCINGVNAGRIAKCCGFIKGFCWIDTNVEVGYDNYDAFVWKR